MNIESISIEGFWRERELGRSTIRPLRSHSALQSTPIPPSYNTTRLIAAYYVSYRRNYSLFNHIKLIFKRSKAIFRVFMKHPDSWSRGKSDKTCYVKWVKWFKFYQFLQIKVHRLQPLDLYNIFQNWILMMKAFQPFYLLFKDFDTE